MRGALARERPEAIAALTELSGRLDVRRMRRLNARLEVNGEDVAVVARDALAELGLTGGDPSAGGRRRRWRRRNRCWPTCGNGAARSPP